MQTRTKRHPSGHETGGVTHLRHLHRPPRCRPGSITGAGHTDQLRMHRVGSGWCAASTPSSTMPNVAEAREDPRIPGHWAQETDSQWQRHPSETAERRSPSPKSSLRACIRPAAPYRPVLVRSSSLGATLLRRHLPVLLLVGPPRMPPLPECHPHTSRTRKPTRRGIRSSTFPLATCGLFARPPSHRWQHRHAVPTRAGEHTLLRQHPVGSVHCQGRAGQDDVCVCGGSAGGAAAADGARAGDIDRPGAQRSGAGLCQHRPGAGAVAAHGRPRARRRRRCRQRTGRGGSVGLGGHCERTDHDGARHRRGALVRADDEIGAGDGLRPDRVRHGAYRPRAEVALVPVGAGARPAAAARLAHSHGAHAEHGLFYDGHVAGRRCERFRCGDRRQDGGAAGHCAARGRAVSGRTAHRLCLRVYAGVSVGVRDRAAVARTETPAHALRQPAHQPGVVGERCRQRCIAPRLAVRPGGLVRRAGRLRRHRAVRVAGADSAKVFAADRGLVWRGLSHHSHAHVDERGARRGGSARIRRGTDAGQRHTPARTAGERDRREQPAQRGGAAQPGADHCQRQGQRGQDHHYGGAGGAPGGGVAARPPRVAGVHGSGTQPQRCLRAELFAGAHARAPPFERCDG
eukprot:ctg_1813.g501